MSRAEAPLVSVIVPVHNAQRWLAQTLTCVLEQTWRRVEIVVVDDGSTDESLAIARTFAGPRVQVIARPRTGATAARQHALGEAQGAYFQYLDADDLLSRDKIERQVTALERAEPDMVASCSWTRFYGASAVPDDRARAAHEPLWRDLAPVDWVVMSAMGPWMMPIHAWLTPRTVAERAGPWLEEWRQACDGEYFQRVVLASRGVRFVDGAWAFYRSGIGGLSGVRNAEVAEGRYAVAEQMVRGLLSREDSARTRAAAAAVYLHFAFDHYPGHPELVRRAEAQARALGGSRVTPSGGPAFQAVRRLIGWKLARRLQRAAFRRSDQGRVVEDTAAASRTTLRPSAGPAFRRAEGPSRR